MTRIHPDLIYLFAIGGAGLATGLQFATPSVALYAAVVAVVALVGVIVTRARLGRAVLAALVAAAIAATVDYVVVERMLQDTAARASAAESPDVRAATAAIGRETSHQLGALIALIAFVQTFIPGVLGSALGALIRGALAVSPDRTRRAAA